MTSKITARMKSRWGARPFCKEAGLRQPRSYRALTDASRLQGTPANGHASRVCGGASGLLGVVASTSTLDAAYDWLCTSRRDWSANADVWSLRANWPREKVAIQADLAAGRYIFSLLTTVTSAKGDDIHLWSARSDNRELSDQIVSAL